MMCNKDTHNSAVYEDTNSKATDNEAYALIEAILNKDNTENIFLYDAKGQKTEFEQIAVVPAQEKLCVILKPVIKLPQLDENEAIVFVIDEIDDTPLLYIAEDNELIDEVFSKYYELLGLSDADIF